MIQVGNYIYIYLIQMAVPSVWAAHGKERKGNLYDLFYKKGGGRRCSI